MNAPLSTSTPGPAVGRGGPRRWSTGRIRGGFGNSCTAEADPSPTGRSLWHPGYGRPTGLPRTGGAVPCAPAHAGPLRRAPHEVVTPSPRRSGVGPAQNLACMHGLAPTEQASAPRGRRPEKRDGMTPRTARTTGAAPGRQRRIPGGAGHLPDARVPAARPHTRQTAQRHACPGPTPLGRAAGAAGGGQAARASVAAALQIRGQVHDLLPPRHVRPLRSVDSTPPTPRHRARADTVETGRVRRCAQEPPCTCPPLDRTASPPAG